MGPHPEAPEETAGAEQAVIGGILLCNKHFLDVSRILRPTDFQSPAHRLIYAAIESLAGRGSPYDVVTLGEILERDEVSRTRVSMQYLGALARDTPTHVNTPAYAGIVRARSLRRQSDAATKRGDLATAAKLKAEAEDLERNGWRDRPTDLSAHFTMPADLFESARVPLHWTIKGMLQPNTLNQVFGASGAGKSALIIDMACSVASGLPWNGRKVKRGPVIYLCGEGMAGVARRYRAWCIHNSVEPAEVPFYPTKGGYELCDEQRIHLLAGRIDALVDQVLKQPPAMIVVDTVARNFGGNENDTADMTRFVCNVDTWLRERYEAALVTVHHCGHADNGRGRGSTVLKGALDMEFKVHRDGDLATLTCTKVKDGELPPDMNFRFKRVNIGLADEDGDPVDSFVMALADPLIPMDTGRIGDAQNSMLEVLRDLYRQHRENLGDRPDAVPRVTRADWKKACFEREVCGKTHFNRNEKRLEDRGLIRGEGVFVYMAGEVD